jgi:hypothetical protein
VVTARGRLPIALLALTMAPVACVLWPEGTGPGAAPMPLAEALERRDRGEAVIVDVRSPDAFAAGHIPGALNVPGSQVEARAAEIRKMGRLPILYCG